MTSPRPGLPRRRFVGFLGGAVVGAATAAPAAALVARQAPAEPLESETAVAEIEPFGPHQPGIAQPTPAATTLVALDLRAATAGPELGRLLRLWSGDIAALTLGRPAPGDTAPELAARGANLTITVGLGPGAFTAAAARRPAGLTRVPALRHDRLDPHWSGGDLVLVVAADEGTTVAHAVRRLVADADPFARVRWVQRGFWNGTAPTGKPITGRNLFGQVDGSGNPRPGTESFDRTVWIDSGPWAGGSTLVLRRIQLDLDTWDALTREEQERSVGRRLGDGAPLTGGVERDDVDLGAVDAAGRPVIARDAHVRRSHPSAHGGRQIFRKGASYVGEPASGPTEHGLLFLSYQADIGEQLTPILRSLDDLDAINEWTTSIGSAEFAVLPGFEPGGWLGEGLIG